MRSIVHSLVVFDAENHQGDRLNAGEIRWHTSMRLIRGAELWAQSARSSAPLEGSIGFDATDSKYRTNKPKAYRTTTNEAMIRATPQLRNREAKHSVILESGILEVMKADERIELPIAYVTLL
ncbi:hypothetical protein QAD02_017330 [Eretmocerus hayati]|uniref:Uncharacterized protein n=1 Tax=Eretmocerus hayati TaxID=131215 RepID=A0ACC2PEN2_9HYME|nr:hypothetical protein QAD02_017330 [Eretmocerus hayati]